MADPLMITPPETKPKFPNPDTMLNVVTPIDRNRSLGSPVGRKTSTNDPDYMSGREEYESKWEIINDGWPMWRMLSSGVVVKELRDGEEQVTKFDRFRYMIAKDKAPKTYGNGMINDAMSQTARTIATRSEIICKKNGVAKNMMPGEMAVYACAFECGAEILRRDESMNRLKRLRFNFDANAPYFTGPESDAIGGQFNFKVIGATAGKYTYKMPYSVYTETDIQDYLKPLGIFDYLLITHCIRIGLAMQEDINPDHKMEMEMENAKFLARLKVQDRMLSAIGREFGLI